ncbi:hypothetical protein EC991_010852 [Linnemannia zychae]|nr:hypothetical protein EC991_010852 [Linnemannia zychae]
MNTLDPLDMSDILEAYEDLLASDEGDILVKLKNGARLKIISFLIKKRSPVFKSMLESSMQEASTGVVDLSEQYSLESFREFMAHIYYNKLCTSFHLPLLFEILSIADYYDVEAYRTYIMDRIIALNTDIPICLMIASEALQYGTLTDKIYASCIKLLVDALERGKKFEMFLTRTTPRPMGLLCYDRTSGDTNAWCCADHSTKDRATSKTYKPGMFTIDGQAACIDFTTRKDLRYHVGDVTGYSERCCIHRPMQPVLTNIADLPDFIVDEVKSAKMVKGDKSE